MALLELRNVWFKYPGMEQYVLKNLSLKLEKGLIYLITGPNGAGKTTLTLVAAGLLKPEKGEVIFRGKPLYEQLPEARRYFGILFQNPEAMLFNPTVFDEVAYGLRQILSDPNEVYERVKETIGRVGLSSKYLSRYVHSLSYGEKKLVAFASIISYDPEILLLDEPFTNLSEEYREKILRILLKMRDSGKSVLIVGHIADVPTKYVDAAFYLNKGHLEPLNIETS